MEYRVFRILLIVFILVILSFCEDSYSRRIQSPNSQNTAFSNIEEELNYLSFATISNSEIGDRYLKIIERCYTIFNSNPEYEEFVDSLKYMGSAFSDYNRYLDSGYSKVDTGTQIQVLFRSIALDITYLLSCSNGYIQGLSSKVFKDVVPLLADSFIGKAVKRKLKNDLVTFLSDSDYATRCHAVSCLGLLIEHYPNQRVQEDITKDITELLYDKNVYVVSATIETLKDVLTTINLNDEMRNDIISSLINLYARPLAYPQNAYLTECLRVVVGNDPETWRREIYEVLSRHDLLNRDKNLSYIFGKINVEFY